MRDRVHQVRLAQTTHRRERGGISTAGFSATCSAAAFASWLLLPSTNVSKVKSLFSLHRRQAFARRHARATAGATTLLVIALREPTSTVMTARRPCSRREQLANPRQQVLIHPVDHETIGRKELQVPAPSSACRGRTQVLKCCSGSSASKATCTESTATLPRVLPRDRLDGLGPVRPTDTVAKTLPSSRLPGPVRAQTCRQSRAKRAETSAKGSCKCRCGRPQQAAYESAALEKAAKSIPIEARAEGFRAPKILTPCGQRLALPPFFWTVKAAWACVRPAEQKRALLRSSWHPRSSTEPTV